MQETSTSGSVYQRVNLFLDRGMTHEDEVYFKTELSLNPNVATAFEKEQSFRDYLRSSVEKVKASPEMIQTIREKIRTASGH